MFEDSALIVAHPDDDILWLSSVVNKVGRTVFCFNDYPCNPDLGAARKKTIAEYPLLNVSTLDIVEAQSYNEAEWDQPVLTEYGIKLSKNPEADARYKKTYTELVRALRVIVADRGNIFTHNPWGEYGHEDHILVYRALSQLRAEYGYALWFSNYCSNRSVYLMNSYICGFNTDYKCLPTNQELVKTIVELYKGNGCWTWYDDYQWFHEECLMQSTSFDTQTQTLPYGHSFPINYLKVTSGPDKRQPKSLLLKMLAGKLKRRLNKIL